MSFVKLGSVKSTDLVLINSVDLAADCGTSILPVANGGTGNGSYTNGQLLIGNSTGNTLTKTTLTGTADQVVVTNGGGSITLSLPQSIATTSDVTFDHCHLTDLTVTNAATIDGVTFGKGVSGCIKIGLFALSSNVSGQANIAVGGSSLSALTTGTGNVSIGSSTASSIVGSDDSVFIGNSAALLDASFAAVTDLSASVLIGKDASPLTNGDTNEIVIGFSSVGEGSNTTVIGNANTTSCHLFGAPKFGDGTDETKTATLDLSGITTGTNRTLTVPNASGTILVSGQDAAVAGLTVSGNTTLGDAAGDTVTVNGNQWTLPSSLVLTKTAQTGVAETILSFNVSDDATGNLLIGNVSSTDGVFAPYVQGTHPSTGPGFNFTARTTTDTGSTGAVLFVGQIGSGTALATRPVAEFRNVSTSVFIVGAAGKGAFGYPTGVGGTVTQATSRTTGVTLSKPCGSITTDTTSLAAGATAKFTVTNTFVGANDTVHLAIKSGTTTDETDVKVQSIAAGSFTIVVANRHASTAETGAIVINFAVIKGATS